MIFLYSVATSEPVPISVDVSNLKVRFKAADCIKIQSKSNSSIKIQSKPVQSSLPVTGIIFICCFYFEFFLLFFDMFLYLYVKGLKRILCTKGKVEKRRSKKKMFK